MKPSGVKPSGMSLISVSESMLESMAGSHGMGQSFVSPFVLTYWIEHVSMKERPLDDWNVFSIVLALRQ